MLAALLLWMAFAARPIMLLMPLAMYLLLMRLAAVGWNRGFQRYLQSLCHILSS